MQINNPTTFSTPDLTLSTSNSSGNAGALRADDTILVYDAAVPDAITFGQSGAAGSAAVSSRRDHAHAMAANPVTAIGTRAYHDADQSIANNSTTTLAFNSTKYDTDTMHDDDTNNSRVTFTTAGYYIVTTNLAWTTSPYGDRIVTFVLNASSNIARWSWETEEIERYLSLTTQYHFDAADYLTVTVYQNEGNPLNLIASGDLSPAISAFKVG